MSARDGGPAFPCEQHETSDGTWNQSFEHGMSLRDWFAGRAMNSFVAWALEQKEFRGYDTAAKASYVIADAMLAARGEAS